MAGTGARVSFNRADSDTPGLCIEVRFCRLLPLSSSPVLEGFSAADVEVRGQTDHTLLPVLSQSVGPGQWPDARNVARERPIFARLFWA